MPRLEEAIDEVLQRAVEQQEVPGVVAMAATPDGPIYEGAFGVRRLGDAQAMTLDTVFRIQSMTKAVTSVDYARGWQISGGQRLWAGQPDIAIEHTEAALRLSPRARIGRSLFVTGFAHFIGRRFDEAIPKLLLAIQEDPSLSMPYRALAACYAHMGRLEDAREIVARLRAITPVVIPDASYLRNPEQRELFLSGLRLAGGEEP